MKWFFEFLTAALFSLMVQNVVFSSGLGLGETIRLARRPKFFKMYIITTMYYTTSASFICGLIDLMPSFKALNLIWHTLIFTLVLSVVYFLSSIFSITVLKASKKFMNSLAMCAMNSLVLALPIINNRSAHGIFSSIGTGIGAGVAFIVAISLLNSGMRRIAQNKDIPKAFRGLPAVFIYTALISLAFVCLSGDSTFI